MNSIATYIVTLASTSVFHRASDQSSLLEISDKKLEFRHNQ